MARPTSSKTGEYGDPMVLAVLADGDYFGNRAMLETPDHWQFTVKALTECTVLMLPRQAFEELISQSAALQTHIEQFTARSRQPQDKQGEAAIELAAGACGRAGPAGHLCRLRGRAARI